MKDLPPLGRAPLLILGFAALATAAAGGMVRLGIVVAAPPAGIAWHGALMASAFFGTLISLERAVAMGRLWAYAAPLACGAGGVALVLGYGNAAFALFVAGAALFSAVSFLIYLKQRALHTAVLALGAVALLVANTALAAGAALAAAALGWVAFFALTIGGERLELSRIARPPLAARRAFAVISALLLAAALAAPWATEAMVRAAGALLVAAAIWLWRYDIATRTVRSSGLTRYIALCLLAGYAWLALGGAILALAGGSGARELWDAALHSVMLGFVFSMVFGHAPVILPAVLRVALPYRPLLYAPLILLHATLALRVAGDLAASASLRAAGGAGNVAAIALFILTAAGLALSSRARAR
ncbi:MAG: hypothetical protein EPO20_12695 [Betaproteobacteria bacterium]|nr:MAG: hypothetical protein EPO20_12695 [Betaproteobacteria bacterium]